MADLKYIGQPAQRVDALDKVMGKTKYVGDMSIPGMLYARTLRSELPHARIVRLDTSPALQVPGVVAVVTSADFVNHSNFGFPISDSTCSLMRKCAMLGKGLRPWLQKHQKLPWKASKPSSAN
jgi:CO/xanthine dehydrogenase Mo-binding subunit